MKVIPKGSNYVPAMGDNIINTCKRGVTYKGKDFRFFDNNSFFHHDFLLMSAYYRVTDEDFNHKAEMNYNKNNIVISDSGGFQILTFGKKGKPVSVTPLQVLRWMENNSDIGMNLDVPPARDFQGALQKSCENFKYFQDNRLNYDFALYNILQGRNLDQIKTWYNAVKAFKFDGWAIGVHPSTNVYLKVLAYLYLKEQGEENILTNCHFFGVSGPANMISLAMLAKRYDSALTFDSSSWSWGQRYRDWWFPLDVRHCVRLGRLFANKMNDIPCDCPVCQSMSIQELYDQSSPMTPLLLSYHDMYQYIEVNRMINCMVDDEETFLEYAKSIGEQNLVTTLTDLFETFESKGSEYTYQKYISLFSPLPKVNPQANLFGFEIKKA
jgi:tRNA-guanine family transglycosylase